MVRAKLSKAQDVIQKTIDKEADTLYDNSLPAPQTNHISLNSPLGWETADGALTLQIQSQSS